MLCIFGCGGLSYRWISLKVKGVIDAATIRILLHLSEMGDARYSELKEEVTRSRSTLALALRELQEERLIEREVVDTRPVQTRYSLTGLGAEVAGHLSEIKRLISGHPE